MITVWWRNNKGMNYDTIINLEKYTGSLSHLFSQGAQLATFIHLRSGMTINNNDIYEVINR